MHLPKSKKMRILLAAFAVVVVGCLALIAFALAPEKVKTTLVPPLKHPAPAWYVALGDSYTAAPALYKQIHEFTPGDCFQSNQNYPHRVAAVVKPKSFTDVSCAGAFTRHLTTAQFTKTGSNAPQADALDEDTALVTIGLSGNDSNLLPLFFSCAGKPHDAAHPSDCVEKYRSNGQDEFLKSVRQTAPKIETMLSVVENRAPNAEVFVVGYPQITPSDGTDCPNEMPFTAADLTYLDEGIQALNAELKSAAKQHGMTYVDTWTPSKGLNVCAPRNKRWIESVVPTSPAFAMHPNPVGESGIALAVLKAIRRKAKEIE
ncbi:MAG: SGNH/GDSL hydrolase family protein [Solirubrobacterales bacterium]